jgi:cbb3-type cytochrome oxidase subunit 3
VTLAIVIIVVVALILLFIAYVAWRHKRRAGGVVATSRRGNRTGGTRQ